MAWEVVEPCPHCGHENLWEDLNPLKCNYKTRCQTCGREIMLCDECLHSGDVMPCNWREIAGCGICYRGVTIN